MSASSDIAEAVAAQLRACSGLPANLPVIARVKRDPRNPAAADLFDAVTAALDNMGACLFVFRPVQKRVTAGSPVIFVEDAILTVRIIDKPELNQTGFDADDLLDAVQLCLHWTNPGDLFAHPLEIADTPVSDSEADDARMIDAHFRCVYQVFK